MQTLTYYFHRKLREQFKLRKLTDVWFEQYPQIFDENDRLIAKNQPLYHFYEWLAAILIFHTTGHLSLVEQYAYKRHHRKNQVLRDLLAADLLDFIMNHNAEYGKRQCPDLFVYKQDMSEWFFCEVKGPTDSISKGQERFFAALAERSGKPIQFVQFRETK